MICTVTRDLVIQHLGHVLGCRPSQHEIDTVVERVAGRAINSAPWNELSARKPRDLWRTPARRTNTNCRPITECKL